MPSEMVVTPPENFNLPQADFCMTLEYSKAGATRR